MILELLKTLNSLSPLAVIALLALVLFYQTRSAAKTDTSFTALSENHLHDLPALAEGITRILEGLQRMEVAHATAFSTILAKLNGGSHDRSDHGY